MLFRSRWLLGRHSQPLELGFGPWFLSLPFEFEVLQERLSARWSCECGGLGDLGEET